MESSSKIMVIRALLLLQRSISGPYLRQRRYGIFRPMLPIAETAGRLSPIAEGEGKALPEDLKAAFAEITTMVEHSIASARVKGGNSRNLRIARSGIIQTTGWN